jgi:DNA-binding PadR family transcriptional regulator
MLEHHVSRKDQSTLYNYWYELSIREKAPLQKIYILVEGGRKNLQMLKCSSLFDSSKIFEVYEELVREKLNLVRRQQEYAEAEHKERLLEMQLKQKNFSN